MLFPVWVEVALGLLKVCLAGFVSGHDFSRAK